MTLMLGVAHQGGWNESIVVVGRDSVVDAGLTRWLTDSGWKVGRSGGMTETLLRTCDGTNVVGIRIDTTMSWMG